jgi:hypothetical protein
VYEVAYFQVSAHISLKAHDKYGKARPANNTSLWNQTGNLLLSAI